MSVALYQKNLKEARRDALVSSYLATHDFSTLPKGSTVTTADDLYEYLLLDTRISDAVTTTRLGEAISSLQLYIHRTLEGYEGELGSTATGLLAQGAFLDNWDRYNKRYSTWAGLEKLRYYAGNYTDPTLRTNKTALFETLENTLSQGKLTTAAVEGALTTFIADCDRYTGMEHLCAGLASADETRLYFTGHLNGQYYWREVWLDKSAGNADCKPTCWGEWQPLPAAIRNPVGDRVVMRYGSHGAQCQWQAQEKGQGAENTSEDIYVQYTWAMGRDGQWAQQLREQVLEQEAPRGINSAATVTRTGFNAWQVKSTSNGTSSFHMQIVGSQLRITGVTSSDDSSSIIDRFISVFIDNSLVHVNRDLADVTFELPASGILEVHIGYNSATASAIQAGIIQPLNLSAPTPWSTFIEDNHGVWLRWGMNSKGKLFTVTAPSVSGQLGAWLNAGIDTLLRYDNQATVASVGKWYYYGSTELYGNAFSGPYGLYLWEVFFHVPYLIAARFATEQRFEEAEKWYKYLFNSAGYRDGEGDLVMDGDAPRYWNCWPLQQDPVWDESVADATDPDVIATIDPMHYRLSVFEHTLDLLIARGDAAYRMLERDTLTEAKMFYVQAQQLLGPRPDIRITNSWANPTLGGEANAVMPATRDARPPVTFAQWLRGASTNPGDGNFLPPYNDVILACFDRLEVRLYNLRHGLTLDGQALTLPLYAAPADPEELHRQQAGGDGAQGDVAPSAAGLWGWRYPLIAERARGAVAQLSQFGSSLLNALERRDSEQMTLLLQTQQINVLSQQQAIARKNLDSLTASLTSLQTGRESAQLRQAYYTGLINGDLSAAEQKGLTLRNDAMIASAAASSFMVTGGALSAVPNIFGFSVGGGDFGAPLIGAGQTAQIIAGTIDQAASISEVSAGYQRRAEEWALQRDVAEKEVSQLEAQITGLQAQIAMQQLQIALAETEAANAQAVYDLQSSRFTGQALYNWMVGRLSALYYQLYDATIPVCLQAKTALEQELGKTYTTGLFGAAVWNDLYQGLLAGEGLTTALQQLDNVWLEHGAQGMEATRTVSLAQLMGEESGNLNARIRTLLEAGDGTDGSLKLAGGLFSATVDLSTLGLSTSYGDKSGTAWSRRIKSVAVTLPTLLGPYQDIEATVSGGGTTATLSHGIQDNGRFITDMENGSRLLPFEGMDATTGTLTLSVFNVGSGSEPGAQYGIVDNLSDVIFHIHYIMRDKA